MKTTEKGTFPGQKEASVNAYEGIPGDERLPRKSEKKMEAEEVRDREIPDHVYATYWG